MSSFKRKTVSKQFLAPGSRSSPLSPLTTITSTGIPSLDDILGGGLPLSCLALTLAPDSHSAYGELVQKYFIAQGLCWGHAVHVIDDDAAALVRDCMWMPKAAEPSASVDTGDSVDAEGVAVDSQDKTIKIAWRYEQMKPFQTTVASSPGMDNFCRPLDLSCKISKAAVLTAEQDGKLSYVDVSSSSEERPAARVLGEISQLLAASGAATAPTVPLRVVVPDLGSPQWGDMSPEDLLFFLHSLRTLLRRHPHACASVSISSAASTDAWGGEGWIRKLGWLADAAVALAAFTGDPALSATFPSHHGLVHIHSLPAPHAILPASDRFSTLRGLAASTMPSGGGGGENNLAFKCTRKRLLIETLHLDVEGGVGERRTTPSTGSLAALDAGIPHEGGSTPAESTQRALSKASLPVVEVRIEDGHLEGEEAGRPNNGGERKAKKAKKRVAFQSDRPDLYDF